jgi:hypothetical protein
MRARWLLGLALVLALGCGKRYAPVSGTVTLNGKPLANASVSFQPIAEKGVTEPGPGSAGKTNDKGEYTLASSTGKEGAIVGKHRVMVSLHSVQVGESDERPPRGGWPQAEKIPDRYNANTELTFDVQSGVSNKADFVLKSP